MKPNQLKIFRLTKWEIIYSAICRFVGYRNKNGGAVCFYYGKELSLFEHEYNCGYRNSRMTERSLEIPIALEWIGKHRGNKITEVGAVSPYYFPGMVEEIIDPYDPHVNVNIKRDMFDFNYFNCYVLSISTVEHIGLGDYGLNTYKNATEAIQKIMSESKHCLITFPIGYNPFLDKWVRQDESIHMNFYTRGKFDNKWRENNKRKSLRKKYGLFGCGNANAICILEK